MPEVRDNQPISSKEFVDRVMGSVSELKESTRRNLIGLVASGMSTGGGVVAFLFGNSLEEKVIAGAITVFLTAGYSSGSLWSETSKAANLLEAMGANMGHVIDKTTKPEDAEPALEN